MAEKKKRCLVQQYLIVILTVKFICPDLCHWRTRNTFEGQFTFTLVWMDWAMEGCVSLG